MPKVIWLLIAVLFTLSVVQAGAEESWKLILDDNLIKHFFDTDSIKVLRDQDTNRIHLDVWIKVTYDGIGKETYRKSLQKAKIPTDGYENFSYTINHLLFEDGKVCLLGVYDYTHAGMILRSFDSPVKCWLDIVPDSTIEVWYQQVMAFATANMRRIINRTRDYTGKNAI
jgi:hypothetical protein